MLLTTHKIYNRAVHSFLAVLTVEDDTGDPRIFVVYDIVQDPDPAPDDSSEDSSADSSAEDLVVDESSGDSSGDESGFVMDESSTDESGSDESSSTEPEVPLYEIFPNRTLVAVASLTDMQVHPVMPTSPGDLYRASTVALLFRSRKHMEAVLLEVTEEVGINARIQDIPLTSSESVELSDPGHGIDIDQLYHFAT